MRLEKRLASALGEAIGEGEPLRRSRRRRSGSVAGVAQTGASRVEHRDAEAFARAACGGRRGRPGPGGPARLADHERGELGIANCASPGRRRRSRRPSRMLRQGRARRRARPLTSSGEPRRRAGPEKRGGRSGSRVRVDVSERGDDGRASTRMQHAAAAHFGRGPRRSEATAIRRTRSMLLAANTTRSTLPLMPKLAAAAIANRPLGRRRPPSAPTTPSKPASIASEKASCSATITSSAPRARRSSRARRATPAPVRSKRTAATGSPASTRRCRP